MGFLTIGCRTLGIHAVLGLARSLRFEYPGSIRQGMSRGILRRSVFEDQRDSERLLEGQKHRVGRFGWYLLGLLLMPSRIHHLLGTQ